MHNYAITVLCALQVKQAMRARGKQPDPNVQQAEAPQPEQPANVKPKGKGRGRGRGKKAQKPSGDVAAPASDAKPVGEALQSAASDAKPDKGVGEAPQSPPRVAMEAKRKVGDSVQTPSKASPNQKAPKEKKRTPKVAADDAAGLQECWAAQDWGFSDK